MNNILSAAILGWSTRNKKRGRQVEERCKDYGFIPILKNVYVGETYPRERKEFDARIRKILCGKTDRFFLVGVCSSCFNSNMIDMGLTGKVMDKSDFEILQMSRSSTRKSRIY